MSKATEAELVTLVEHCATFHECDCGGPDWREHLCSYHQGWVDGWDARTDKAGANE